MALVLLGLAALFVGLVKGFHPFEFQVHFTPSISSSFFHANTEEGFEQNDYLGLQIKSIPRYCLFKAPHVHL